MSGMFPDAFKGLFKSPVFVNAEDRPRISIRIYSVAEMLPGFRLFFFVGNC